MFKESLTLMNKNKTKFSHDCLGIQLSTDKP
jgi:hypothetical protein